MKKDELKEIEAPKSTRSIGDLLITELLYSIINESALELDFNSLQKIIVKSLHEDSMDSLHKATQLMINYRERLIGLLEDSRWYSDFSESISGDIRCLLKKNLDDNNKDLVSIDLESDENVKLNDYLIYSALGSVLAQNETSTNDNAEEIDSLKKLKSLYESLPFQ